MQVLEALERVNRELGTTTAIITHNAPIAAMADRVITLADGRIAATSSRERAQDRRRGAALVSALDRKLLPRPVAAQGPGR